MTSIACSGNSLLNPLSGNSFQVSRPSNSSEKVDESFRKVQVIVTKFRCLIVPRKNAVNLIVNFDTPTRTGHFLTDDNCEIPHPGQEMQSTCDQLD